MQANSAALPTLPGRRVTPLIESVGIALAYFALAKLGLGLASIHPSVSPIWPASGLAIAAGLLWGYRALPGIFAGAFLANATTAGSIFTSVSIASGNTIEALAAAYLIRRYSDGPATFETPAGVARFAILCFSPSTLLSASIGASTLCAGGYAEWTNFVPIWLTWWLGDFAGALVVAPPLVLWANRVARPLLGTQNIELIALIVTTFVIGLAAFSPVLEQTTYRGLLAFLAIVPLMWAALRMGQIETASTSLVLSFFAVWGTLADGGPFARATINESFLVLITFMISTAVPSLALGANVNTHRRAQQALKDSEGRLKRAQEAGYIGNWEWNPSLRTVWWSDGMYELVRRNPDAFHPLSKHALDVVHPDDQESLKAAFRELLAGVRQRVDLEFRVVWPDGSVRWLLGRAEAERDSGGQTASIVGVCLDITQRRDAEDQQKWLTDELNHRVKNTLASVQSLAVMSMRHAKSPEAFATAFLSRIQALSSTHDVLTARNWRAASLTEVLECELRPYLGEDVKRVHCMGPTVALNPNQVVSFGLLFHELATNAAKYGALSVASGRLYVTWEVEAKSVPSKLMLSWREECGRPVTKPTQSGSGRG